ncbi:DUF2213 domain-containing protein [Acetobacter senegalensis]|uniref:DUF2213 domain-containing protein n=1 Tax=Acetobacter senegalensis TaxID=446692 RepID=UPI001EDF1628|nr:DUF2213 domain-containing protein [Acetobacter senegalensis]MCG4273905.1 DUF2213 domain-containing protein [Acetobacter senegalensis]
MTDILAYDRMGSVRTTDAEGRLRVAATPISKANICPYMGREIPSNRELGLDPERIYQMLRDPDELKKAASSFNGLPVLEEHYHVTAANPRRDLVVGTTGNEATFDAPYLMNSLVIWDGDAIDRIKTGEQRELSSAYRYKADMTPGEYEGEKYDGVMRDIVGSHVAVVPSGRAGPDVLVADAQLEDPNMKKIPKNKQGALLAKLRPFLAQDADLEACKKAMDEDMDNKTAKDDACETLRNLLGGRVPDEIMGQVLALFENASSEGAENVAEDDSPEERRAKLREAGFSDDEIDKMIAALASVAEDEEQTEADRQREAEAARRVDEERAEKERKDREAEAAGAKAAMDAAISKAKSEAKAETMSAMRALVAAQAEVEPFVGSVTMDSAEGVHRFALRQLGYDLSGIPASAYGAMFRQHAANAQREKRPVLAADSKAGTSFLDNHPGLKAVKIAG